MSIINALAKASGARLSLLKACGAKIHKLVYTSGGSARVLHNVLYRDWPGHWNFKTEDEASLRGLSKVIPATDAL